MAMNITVVTAKVGPKPKRKRVGRGESSGHGKTSCRGNKGCGARAGYRPGDLYEGGMFPLFRRLPKFGFSNKLFRTEYPVVNVSDLDSRFENGGHVTAAALEAVGLIGDRNEKVKILGEGELAKKLTVQAHRFSASAASKIEAAGGTVTRLGPQPKKKFVKRPKPPAETPPAKEEGEAKGEKKKQKAEGQAKGEKKQKPEGEAKGGKKKNKEESGPKPESDKEGN
jgi:large subunit ribosomal protein L15